LVLNLSNLPAHSLMPRNVALTAAVVIFAAGLWFAFGKPAEKGIDVAHLHAHRDRLLNEIVALERKKRERPLNDAESAKLQRLTGDLERVMAELDSGAAA
jgi:hypothetical protein